jgi:hypothetical protein
MIFTTSFVLYCIISLLSVPVLYYIFSHLLYSQNLLLNVLSYLLLIGASKMHIDIGRSGVLPFTDYLIHDYHSIMYALFPLAFWFLSVFAFGRGYGKYFRKIN